MTKKQCSQFNQMRNVLLRIRAYQSPSKLQRDSEKDWGLPYFEALEYAYENIQAEASGAVKGVRAVALEKGNGRKQTTNIQSKQAIKEIAARLNCIAGSLHTMGNWGIEKSIKREVQQLLAL